MKSFLRRSPSRPPPQAKSESTILKKMFLKVAKTVQRRSPCKRKSCSSFIKFKMSITRRANASIRLRNILRLWTFVSECSIQDWREFFRNLQTGAILCSEWGRHGRFYRKLIVVRTLSKQREWWLLKLISTIIFYPRDGQILKRLVFTGYLLNCRQFQIHVDESIKWTRTRYRASEQVPCFRKL